MVNHDKLLNAIKELISDMGYTIVLHDINRDKQNTIGLYLRQFGSNIGNLENSNDIQVIELVVRLHTENTTGGNKKGFEDIANIADRICICNTTINGVRIIGSKILNNMEKLGETTNGIPVFGVSFVLNYC